MDKQVARNILAFLERITLSPKEIQAFMEITQELTAIINAEETT
jgi:hypothetical protein